MLYYRMRPQRSRLVFEEDTLRIPGVHSLGQYHYNSAEPGLPPHRHRGCVEISLLARGYQAYQIGGKIYQVKGGEQYISLPDEIHDTGSEPEEKGICSVEKLGMHHGALTIKGVGQHLEGGFLEEAGGLAGQQG